MTTILLCLGPRARPDEVFATYSREPSAPVFERSRGTCNLLLCANYMIRTRKGALR